MLTAQDHLRREWLNARSHALEIAAILDRIDRAGGPAIAADPDYRRIQEILDLLRRPPVPGERAASILEKLSAPRQR
jgi:hypothetical protein